MSRNTGRGIPRRMLVILLGACVLVVVGVSRPTADSAQPSPNLAAEEKLAAQSAPAPNLTAERKLAATVSETRMVETVRRLVGFGPRMYGTPSNHETATWLAGAFREAGLEVTVRQDTPRDWYQPVSWEVQPSATGPAAQAWC
jgi:hypothetical protein